MKKIQKFDAFKEYNILNLKELMGGAYWREGSSFQYAGHTSSSDDELVSAFGEYGCDSPNGCIDGAYDCGDATVLFQPTM